MRPSPLCAPRARCMLYEHAEERGEKGRRGRILLHPERRESPLRVHGVVTLSLTPVVIGSRNPDVATFCENGENRRFTHL